MFSMAARAKHDAWVLEAGKHADDVEGAKARYIEIAKEIGWEGGKSGSGGAMGGVRVSMMASEEEKLGESSGTSGLHDAVIDGDQGRVRRIVKEGSDVNGRDEYVGSFLTMTLLDYVFVGGADQDRVLHPYISRRTGGTWRW